MLLRKRVIVSFFELDLKVNFELSDSDIHNLYVELHTAQVCIKPSEYKTLVRRMGYKNNASRLSRVIERAQSTLNKASDSPGGSSHSAVPLATSTRTTVQMVTRGKEELNRALSDIEELKKKIHALQVQNGRLRLCCTKNTNQSESFVQEHKQLELAYVRLRRTSAKRARQSAKVIREHEIKIAEHEHSILRLEKELENTNSHQEEVKIQRTLRNARRCVHQ